MVMATHNQQTPKEGLPFSFIESISSSTPETDNKIKPLGFSAQFLLPSRLIMHHPKAGLNPLADAAAYLFSALGKLKQLKTYRQLNKLHKELIHEISSFQENIKNHGYNAEYVIVCRYILCATFDDIIQNTIWGGQGQWDSYSLLVAFNQDAQHQDKFFTITERAIKEPASYIDLMELIYICLSLGYKGHYRVTEHGHHQLEQITNNLYKHIRAYRGSFHKALSPSSLKTPKSTTKVLPNSDVSLLFLFFLTTCIIMVIFVSLGYLMDIISNEAYKHIIQIEASVSHETHQS